MNSLFGSVFWLLVTLGVLVTLHEFGHYWVARRCGVKVLRFSIGFGPALFKWRNKSDTEFWLATIPLGGYVKMLDKREQADGDAPLEAALADQEFTGKPVLQRMAIAFAGPACNLLFTLLAMWVVFMLGKPDVAPIVTAEPQSLAASAGIRPGDRILAVGDRQVSTMSEMLDALANGMLARQPLPMTLQRAAGSQQQITLPLERLPADQDIGQYLVQLGLHLASSPAVITAVEPGLPAAQAGLQSGDKLISVNGQPVTDAEQFARRAPLEAAKSPALKLGYVRDGQAHSLDVTASYQSRHGTPARWLIGVAFAPPEPAMLRYGPFGAARAALLSTWEHTATTFAFIGKLLSGQTSTKNLSGVIGIAQGANATAHMGLPWFLDFLALVSLNLAVLNLLPIPILDGGHLLYYLVELVKGRPVSERVMLIGQYLSLVLVIALMGLALYNDIQRALP